MVDIGSFRFVIPPFIAFLIVLLAMITDPTGNLNSLQEKFPGLLQGLDGFATAFLGIVILVFRIPL